MKKKVICFDIDGTLLDGNSWLLLTKGFGCPVEKHVELYEDTVSGKRPFVECERELVEMWRESGEASRKNVKEIYSHLHPRKEAKEVFSYLKERGFLIYLVSGANSFFVEGMANILKPDGYYSNAELLFDKDDIISRIDQRITEQGEIKVRQVQDIAEKNNLSIKDIYFVGDSDNDIDAFVATGNGISVHCSNDYLKEVSWKKIETLNDLKNIFS